MLFRFLFCCVRIDGSTFCDIILILRPLRLIKKSCASGWPSIDVIVDHAIQQFVAHFFPMLSSVSPPSKCCIICSIKSDTKGIKTPKVK